MAELLTVDDAEVQEYFFEQGWTDGLPIVAPTPPRVRATLEAGCVPERELLGAIPQRGKSIDAEQAAICA
ncbi:MAG: thioredoxin family protein, partial [Solirubrobacteraceae bacterium]